MEKIKEAAAYIRSRCDIEPQIGVILGTGLGGLVEQVDIICELPYDEIPHFPVSTVESHHGKLLIGNLNGKSVVVMQGRFHHYEGYTMQQITLPVRVMKMLGVEQLLVSNAAGGLNPKFQVSDLMIINDHINLFPENPLTGVNLGQLGPSFPDMSEPYSNELNEKMRSIASNNSITLHEGVYVAAPGPMLETRAEYRYMRRIGADVVGMSTVPEAIAARHMSLPCAAISVITDECDPDNLAVANIVDILKTAAKAEKDLVVLVEELVKVIS